MGQTTFETMNMVSVTVERFIREVEDSVRFDNVKPRPILGIGKSGIGKTEAIFELTRKLGIGFKEMRLVNMTITDIVGVPIVTEDNRTKWAANGILPVAETDGERGILVLDEITSADADVRATSYQLLDSKRSVGEYVLPDGWLVVGLGNGADDGGVYKGMENAMLSRCDCYRVEPDLTSWKHWALTNQMNPSVVAYVSYQVEDLHNFLEESGMANVFPCPRAWAALGKKLNDREARNGGKTLDEEDIILYAGCCVGSVVANKFAAFYAYNKQVISIESIFDGTASSDLSNMSMEAIYITAQQVAKYCQSFLASRVIGDITNEDPLASTISFSRDTMQTIAHMFNWLNNVTKKRTDLGMMIWTDLQENVPIFLKCIADPEFDVICPAILEFSDANYNIAAQKIDTVKNKGGK